MRQTVLGRYRILFTVRYDNSLVYILTVRHGNVFRNTMGVESDEELAASLQAINDAMGDLNAGNTIPLADAKQRLDTKYGVHD